MSSLAASILRQGMAAATVIVAACASFGPQLAAPKVNAVTVRLDRVQDARAFFGVTVELANPNPTAIDVEALDAAVAIEGEVVASAALVAPVRVPGNGTANAELAAQTGVDALLRAAMAAMRRGATVVPGRPPTLRYAIEGLAVFNGGIRVPFGKSGELGSPPGAGAR